MAVWLISSSPVCRPCVHTHNCRSSKSRMRSISFNFFGAIQHATNFLICHVFCWYNGYRLPWTFDDEAHEHLTLVKMMARFKKRTSWRSSVPKKRRENETLTWADIPTIIKAVFEVFTRPFYQLKGQWYPFYQPKNRRLQGRWWRGFCTISMYNKSALILKESCTNCQMKSDNIV